MKLVTTLLLAATCSAFALDDGPIFQCDREWYEGFMAISRLKLRNWISSEKPRICSSAGIVARNSLLEEARAHANEG